MAIPAFAELNKRQQMAVLIGAPCAGLILLGWLSHRALGRLGPDPSVPSIVHLEKPENLWSQIIATQAQVAEKEAIIAEGPKIEVRLKELEEEIREAEQRLPTEAAMSDMRQLIERLAREIPVDIGTVRYKSVRIIPGPKGAGGRGGSDYQTITYQTEVEGDLNGIIKYIDALEKNPRFMTIKSMSIKPGDMRLTEGKDKIAYGLHAVNLEVVTYVYTAPQKGRGK